MLEPYKIKISQERIFYRVLCVTKSLVKDRNYFLKENVGSFSSDLYKAKEFAMQLEDDDVLNVILEVNNSDCEYIIDMAKLVSDCIDNIHDELNICFLSRAEHEYYIKYNGYKVYTLNH